MSDVFAQNPQLFTLKNKSGMTATIMDWGATLISVKVPVDGQMYEMLVGPKNPEDYAKQDCYLGATIGRYANRIDNCTFEANQKSYTIETNGAQVALHGGKEGFDKRRFTLVEQNERSVSLKLHSPDGDQGFPGNFDLKVIYTLDDDGALKIDYEASCDQECPACITNHSYFNLNGRHSSVLDHEAMFNSEEILVINEKAIPTGELYNITKRTDKVDNFNFTQFKPLAKGKDSSIFKEDENMRYSKGYDHAFVIRDFGNATTACATFRGETITDNKRIQLEVFTDYPAFQFYSGNFLKVEHGVDEPITDFEGFALEPEYFPNAPHLEQFKHINPMISPSAPLKKFITYKFTII